MSEREVAIEVIAVSKHFLLPHERKQSVKSVFTSLFKKDGIKTTERQQALQDISFSVHKGEFFGIVGRNGSGKSTLLKILAGIYQPSSGQVSKTGKLVPFIELGVGFNPELTGRENVYLNGAMLGFSKSEIEAMYDGIVEFAELERFMDQKLKNYSSGMQVRLAFSMATRADADILLVDEVLAVGDAAFQRKCFEYFKDLKANKKTVVFVTHDMSAIKEYCDRAILINDSKLEFSGDPQEISREYALLFMDKKQKEDQHKKDSGDRWGTNAAQITSAKTVVESDAIVTSVTIKANEDIDKLQFGMHIIGRDGEEITAANNRMLQKPDIIGLKKGDKATITWNMLNIFNDGSYYVTLTLVDDVGQTLDWFTKATQFEVRRIERSTTPVLPPISLKVTKP